MYQKQKTYLREIFIGRITEYVSTLSLYPTDPITNQTYNFLKIEHAMDIFRVIFRHFQSNDYKTGLKHMDLFPSIHMLETSV